MKILLVFLFAITLSVCHGFVLDILRGLTTCSDSQQSISPATDIEQSCLDDADKGMCRFYDCFERRYPCDSCGFAKEYGKNVCEKFETPTIYNRFDDAGKRWADATNRCLLATMKELYQRPNVRCEVTRTTMLEQVSNCYLFNDAGASFCDIAVANREALRAVFEAGKVIRSPRVLTEVVQLITTCASLGSNPIADRVRDFRANNNSLQDLRNRIRERIVNATSGGLGGRLRDVIAESGASGNGIAARIGDILSNRGNTIVEHRDRIAGQVVPLRPQSNQLTVNGQNNNTRSGIGRGELLSQTFNRIEDRVKQLLQDNQTPLAGSQNNRTPVFGGFFRRFLRRIMDIEQSCLDDADKGMCRFYDCFERRYPCDSCGFAKEYGKNVCEKFETPTIYNRFDDAGKRWADATNRCLLATMKELYQRPNVRCEVTRTTMLEQVSNCYLFNDAGASFCDIAVANREALRAVFEAGKVIRKDDRERIVNATSGGLGGRLRDVIAESGASGNGIAARIGDILSNRGNTIVEHRDRIAGQVVPLRPQSNQLTVNGQNNNTRSGIGRGELLSQTFNRIEDRVKQLLQDNQTPLAGSQNNRTPVFGGFFRRFLRRIMG